MASDPEQMQGGYWRAVAEGFIHGQLIKPFFGRSYLKFGQCFGLWGCIFELGGILGAKHAVNPDAFVSAFLGISGEAGVAKRVLVAQATRTLERHSLGSMKLFDFIGADVADRIGYKGDGRHSLVLERGARKTSRKIALTNAWEYASDGTALGTIHPDVLRAMFERTHAAVSSKNSGNNSTLLDWTLDQSHPQPTMGKLRRLRIKISWNIADNFAQTHPQARQDAFPRRAVCVGNPNRPPV